MSGRKRREIHPPLVHASRGWNAKAAAALRSVHDEINAVGPAAMMLQGLSPSRPRLALLSFNDHEQWDVLRCGEMLIGLVRGPFEKAVIIAAAQGEGEIKKRPAGRRVIIVIIAVVVVYGSRLFPEN